MTITFHRSEDFTPDLKTKRDLALTAINKPIVSYAQFLFNFCLI